MNNQNDTTKELNDIEDQPATPQPQQSTTSQPTTEERSTTRIEQTTNNIVMFIVIVSAYLVLVAPFCIVMGFGHKYAKLYDGSTNMKAYDVQIVLFTFNILLITLLYLLESPINATDTCCKCCGISWFIIYFYIMILAEYVVSMEYVRADTNYRNLNHNFNVYKSNCTRINA